jgi:hypothetical protein
MKSNFIISVISLLFVTEAMAIASRNSIERVKRNSDSIATEIGNLTRTGEGTEISTQELYSIVLQHAATKSLSSRNYAGQDTNSDFWTEILIKQSDAFKENDGDSNFDRARGTILLAKKSSGAGNGGNVFRCENRDGKEEYRLFDFVMYEAKSKNNPDAYKIDMPHNSSYIRIVDLLLERLKKVAPVRAKLYEGFFKIFKDQSNYTNYQDGVLKVTVDSVYASAVTEGCDEQPIRVITQKHNDQTFFSRNFALWTKLSSETKAAIALHELVYMEASYLGHTNAGFTQDLSVILASEQLKTMKPRRLYQQLQKYQFLSTQNRISTGFYEDNNQSFTLLETFGKDSSGYEYHPPTWYSASGKLRSGVLATDYKMMINGLEIYAPTGSIMSYYENGSIMSGNFLISPKYQDAIPSYSPVYPLDYEIPASKYLVNKRASGSSKRNIQIPFTIKSPTKITFYESGSRKKPALKTISTELLPYSLNPDGTIRIESGLHIQNFKCAARSQYCNIPFNSLEFYLNGAIKNISVSEEILHTLEVVGEELINYAFPMNLQYSAQDSANGVKVAPFYLDFHQGGQLKSVTKLILDEFFSYTYQPVEYDTQENPVE